jgi:hypothetical protein
LQRALELTQLKYGGKTSGIVQAIKEANQQRVDTVRQARSGARYATDAERYGQKDLHKSYGAIGAAAQQSGTFMDQLSPAQPGTPASAVMAAIASSRAAIPTNVAQMETQAVQDSQGRAARARSGGQFAEQAANVNFAGTVGKLRDQLSQTQSDAGLSTDTTYQSLLNQDQKSKLDQRKVTDAENKDAYQKANGLGPYKPAAKPKGKSHWLTPVQQNAYNQKVSEALAWVKKYASAPGTKGKDIHQWLESGGTYIKPKKTNAAGDEVPSYGNSPAFGTDVARIAMDLYFNSPHPGTVPGTLTRTSKNTYRKAKVQPPKKWLG